MHNRGKSIVLIGMMGAGKSSVGRCLQQLTGLQRIDTDELVAAQAGISIPEIFGRDGEEKFRESETAVLRELSTDRPAIIVTGGGMVLRPENVHLLKRLGIIVWLEAKEEVLFERASRRGNRPLLKTENPKEQFAKILETRGPIYERAAEIRIETTRHRHDEVAELILEEIEKRNSALA